MALIKPVKGFSVDALTEADLTALASALGVEKADLYNMITKGGELTSGGLDNTNDYFPLSDASAGAAKKVNLYQLTAFFKSHLEISKKAQFKTGTYNGTGTYGSGNPCTIVCGFKPSFVLFISQNGSNKPMGVFVCAQNSGYVAHLASSYCYTQTVTTSDNGMSWYGEDAKKQGNESGKSYEWVAIG